MNGDDMLDNFGPVGTNGQGVGMFSPALTEGLEEGRRHTALELAIQACAKSENVDAEAIVRTAGVFATYLKGD
jgi:hypothetical protein